MTARWSIEFHETPSPIADIATKFGGQPHWLQKPQWPLSRGTGKPMQFIGQIVLQRQNPRMAYLFMSDGSGADGTWEPEGGENAVIIQPSGSSPIVACHDQAKGPSLYKMVQKPGAARLTEQPCEFSVAFVKSEDPAFQTEAVRSAGNAPLDPDSYFEAISGNKIGGTPMFIQNDEFPEGGPWRLLLQLDSTQAPFYVNFGDGGVGYAFISENGEAGRFLWQCM